MPLVNKKPFLPEPIPTHLGPDDEVFYHELTNEIFTNYDEFFDRFLYCNSLIWTCSRTGKSGLTFKEALDSELAIRKSKKRGKRERPAEDDLQDKPISKKASSIKKEKYEREHADSEQAATSANENDDTIGPVKKKKKKYPYDPKKYSMPVPDGFDPSLLTPTGKIDGRKLKSKKNQILAEALLSTYPVPEKKRSRKSAGDSEGTPKKTGKQSKKSAKEELAKRKEEEAARKAQHQAELAREREAEAKRKKEAAALAKQQERQRKEEERKKAAAFLQNWEKKCEDLERDDLKRLPQPVPLNCDIPERLFGDSMFILESLYNLHDLYNLSKLFPEGMSYDTLEEILLDGQEDGSLGNLVKFLLRTILDTQPTSDGYGLDDNNLSNNNTVKQEKSNGTSEPVAGSPEPQEGHHENNHDQQNTEEQQNGLGSEHGDDDERDLIRSAIRAAQEVKRSLTKPLPEMEITDQNVTDILRLHLLQSGSFPKGRTIYNGWYSSREDPGLWLCMQEPDLIKKLHDVSIYDLDIEERIKIIHTLIYQLFTFIKTRTYIESASEPLTELRKAYRQEAANFARWDRENCVKLMHDNHHHYSKQQGNQQVTEANQTEDNNNSEQQHPNQTQEELERAKERNQIEYDDYQRERAIRYEDLTENVLHIKANLRTTQAIYGIHPVGRDRAYRRYWIFESLPGLFIEHDEHHYGRCLAQPTPLESQYKKLFNKDNPLRHPDEDDLLRIKTCDAACSTNNSPKPPQVESRDREPTEQPNEAPEMSIADSLGVKIIGVQPGDDNSPNHELDDNCQGEQPVANCVHEQNGNDHEDQDDDRESYLITDEMNYCTGDETTCAVHGQKRCNQSRWWFYHTPESIDTLVECLNKRGYRESKLQDILATEAPILKPKIATCPAHKLNKEILEQSGIRRSRRLKTRGNKRRVKNYD